MKFFKDSFLPTFPGNNIVRFYETFQKNKKKKKLYRVVEWTEETNVH